MRGKLKIFLGMAAGVGKTYSMLENAHQQVEGGIDVLVGVVDTHGRKETAKLLEGLKCLPEKTVSYKGIAFKELDIDAVLEAKPQLVLIDELAHTNIPGSRHIKRWQDVMEILSTGIDVYTTLNIQHLESFRDIVETIVGSKMGETVPDSILTQAAEIELVDLTPAELLQRLREGKVYTGDLGEIPPEHFFQEDRLTALREISLRLAAEKVDQTLHEMIATIRREKGWKPRERLLVVIDEQPSSGPLLRTTRRLAFSLHAPWIALYVDTGKRLNEEETTALNKNLALARELGGEVLIVKEADMAAGLKRVALQKSVTQIIVDKIPKKLIKPLSEIDIHLVRRPRFLFKKKKLHPRRAKWTILSILALLFASAAIAVIFSYLEPLGQTIIFWIVFSLLVIAGLYSIFLQEKKKLLLDQENSTQAIYEIIREIAMGPSLTEIFKTIQEKVGNIVQGVCEIIVKRPEDGVNLKDGSSIVKGTKEKAVAEWALKNGQPAGWSTSTLPMVKNLYLPLRGFKNVVGILAYRPMVERQLLPDQLNFLYTVAQLLSYYLERRFSEDKERKEEFHHHIEKVYGRVLSSISLELYPPLMEIKKVVQGCEKDEELVKIPRVSSSIHEVEKNIDDLLRIIENARMMERLSAGLMHFEKSLHSIKELVDSCLKKRERALKNHTIKLTIPEEMSKISFDFDLIEISLSNLLSNAALYSPLHTTIEIAAGVKGEFCYISVADEGKGIPSDLMDLIFEKFYRVPGTPSKGLGLGLPIAKTILELHGGLIQAENRSPVGAKFTLFLPLMQGSE